MTAEQIVRALAAREPIHDGSCAICQTYRLDAEHQPDCPWRLAVEWVAVQGGGPGRPADTWTRYDPPQHPWDLAAITPQDFAWFAFAADPEIQEVEVRDGPGDGRVTVRVRGGDLVAVAAILDGHRPSGLIVDVEPWPEIGGGVLDGIKSARATGLALPVCLVAAPDVVTPIVRGCVEDDGGTVTIDPAMTPGEWALR